MLDSAATPGGCWAHFSAVLVPGYRELQPGAAVEFTAEAGHQDGYAFRAVEVWPTGELPVRGDDQVAAAASPAYRSTFTVTFDGDGDGDGDGNADADADADARQTDTGGAST